VKTFDKNRFRNARRCCAKFSGVRGAAIQYVEHTEGDGGEIFKAVCKLGLEGIVSKKVDAPYKSGPSKVWLKIKNPKAPAATRATDGTF
jgi:ATP-dependent DNA ligase